MAGLIIAKVAMDIIGEGLIKNKCGHGH